MNQENNFKQEVSQGRRVGFGKNGKGFQLQKLKTCAGKYGCNEYVFKRIR